MNRFNHRLVVVLLAIGVMAVLCLAGAGNSLAQSPTAAIVGTVIDQQGLPTEGADVTLTNIGTNYQYKTATSSTGAYRFSSLDHGLYRVRVEAKGFRAAVVDNIKLDAATDFTVPPIRMELGAATESITVEAGAELVNTTNAEISSTVEKKQIDELPILDRNPLGLLSLEAGINQNGATNTVIGGQRTSYSNLTLDGINIQDNLFRENALDFSPNLPFNSQAQEFTVINQNAGVEYGGGASQVSIVTPKGTNTLHGEGFWYYRTNAWAANDWFNAASGVPTPGLLQNQGGGNMGGPILKNKLFVYGWYELLRLRAQSSNNTTVINPTILSALTSGTPTLPFTYQAFDPGGAPDPNGPYTVDLLSLQGLGYTPDPYMLDMIKRIPASLNNNTRVGDKVNLLGYQLNEGNNRTRDNYGVRVDYDLNAHNSISGTWAWNRDIVDRPDIDTSYNKIPLVTNSDKIKFLSTAWRWSPSGAVTNELRFGFNLAPAIFATSQKFGSFIVPGTDPTTGAAVLPWTTPDPNFLPQGRNTRTWSGLDNASWVHGNHVIKFGTQISRITIFDYSQFGIYPQDVVGYSTANPNGFLRSEFPATSGYRIASSARNNANQLLSGAAGILNYVQQSFYATSQTSQYVSGAPENRNYRENQYAVYAGDSWRVSPRLTLNYGLRWEYYGPVDEKNGLVLLPVVPTGSTVNQVLLGNANVDFAGGNSRRGLYGGYWKAFAPSIGVAWDPFGNGKTSIRAGFSINYVNDDFFAAANNAAAGNTGLSAISANTRLAGPTVSDPMGNQTVTEPPFPAFPVDFNTNAFNATNTSGSIGSLAGYAIDPHLKPPQVQQWSVSVQRDIGWNTSVSVSYVGNHGVGLFRAIDLNQLNFKAKDVNGNNFFTDFQNARAAGFASLAATGTFDPLYGCPGDQTSPTCLPVFNLLYGGAIGLGPGSAAFLNDYIEQGQVGQLIATYHAFEFDTGPGAYPGQANLINWFPNPYIMGADLLKNTSFSTYHAGIVEVRRRLNRGLYFQANYTYSKVMTDFGGSQSQFQPVQDNARPQLERARAPFDLTHAFKANFTYEVPIGKGHNLFGSPNRVLGLLVNGWQTGSIFTWQSGSPFSILSQYATFNRGGSRSVNNTAFATQTHQQISGNLGVFVQPGGVVYGINPKLISPDGTGAPASPQLSCVPAVSGGFCNPQPGEVGNLQLDAFSGPKYFDWDLSAAKDFYLTERVKLTFRTEAFNLLNHPVFFMGDQHINDTTFGQSTSTVSVPRVLQMSLRLKF